MTSLLETPLSIVCDTSHRGDQSLTIGVVNNMPDAAFRATADQFDRLLRQALPDGIDLNVRFFCAPNRSEARSATATASERHEAAHRLWTAALDGLIVTGTEPQAAHIAEEPCLPFLSQIVAWVEQGALPTLWSCLAAHAAVYRLDGIERRQRATKLFGVFQCDKTRDHPLLNGAGVDWTMPHSRFNELSETELTAQGYQILTRSADVGADTFVKQLNAPHLFLNGHPEYDQTTLCSEYRRDVRRFLLGERTQYPSEPTDYFSDNAVLEMAAFREMALAQRSPELMTDFPPTAGKSMPWRDTAHGLFHNWLLETAQRKVNRVASFGVQITSDSNSPRLSPWPASSSITAGTTQEQAQLGRQTL